MMLKEMLMKNLVASGNSLPQQGTRNFMQNFIPHSRAIVIPYTAK